MRPSPYILLLALVTTAPITAQQVDWLTAQAVEYELNPGLPDHVIASAPGYLVGMRQSTVAFIYGQQVLGEVILERIDPLTGAQGWWCTLFDSISVSSATVDDNGMAYFAGTFMGNLSLCDGSIVGGVPGQAPYFENLFILAADIDLGQIVWVRNLSFDHDQAIDVPSMTIDPNGDLWYAISEWGTAQVVRVDAMGNDVEARLLDGPRLVGTIDFDPWGGLYVSGSADNSGFAFGGAAFQDYGDTGYSMFVLRYKPDGTAGFIQFADDVTFQGPTVVATADGHAYVAGSLLDQTNWGGMDFNGPDWVYATLLAKLDSTGQFLWGVESDPPGGAVTGDMDRSKGPCVTVDANDHPYLYGNLRGMVDWGNGVVSDGLTLGANSITIVSFSPEGIPQWEATSNPTGFFNMAQNVTAKAEENALHFGGHISGQFMFPPHTVGEISTQSALVGRIGAITTTVHEHNALPKLSAWPNPAMDLLYVEMHGFVNVTAELLNGRGQSVQAFITHPGRNVLDLSNCSSGPYVLRTSDGRAVRLMIE